MYLLHAPFMPLSFCKILKKFLQQILSYEDVPFLGQKWPTCPEKKFFGTNYYYCFHLPISPFHCANLQKIIADPVMRMRHIGDKMVHLPQTNIFQNIIFIYVLPPYIV